MHPNIAQAILQMLVQSTLNKGAAEVDLYIRAKSHTMLQNKQPLLVMKDYRANNDIYNNLRKLCVTET